MKTITTSKKANSGPRPQKIRIEFHDEQAREVCIAGTFNEWRPTVTPMLALGGGRWVKELTLPPGRYQYQFVVDGAWRRDPAAAGQVANPFGGFNSVLEVPAASPPSQGLNDEEPSGQFARRRRAAERLEAPRAGR